MRAIGDHAVVLGASMSGLLAARVLADGYGQVTLIERDVLTSDARGLGRRGVPQGRHAHALLPRGGQILDELFPGILAELVAAGAPVIDYRQLHFSVAGHRVCAAADPGQVVYQPSRPFLEDRVRARVRTLDTVEFIDNCDVVGLAANGQPKRVTGVRVFRRAQGSVEETLGADLVVDATDRGSRAPLWLSELGYRRPVDEQVPVGIRYASQRLRLPVGAVTEKLVTIGAKPGRPTSATLLAQESDCSMLTVAGYAGYHPPADRDGIVDFAVDAMPAHVIAAVRDADPLGPVITHNFPANQRRRYERMHQFPDGLIVFGDAVCSFNPLYAQGMTVAALQAMALRRCLDSGPHDLPRRFFRAAAKPLNVAWQLATGADLALPEVPGPRPARLRALNAYLRRLAATAENDPQVARQFLRVIGMLDPPSRLFHPALALRVLGGSRRRGMEPGRELQFASQPN